MATNPIQQPRFVNLQAANAASFWQATAYWLGQKTKRDVDFALEGHWTDWRDEMAAGEASLGTCCGSYYVDWAAGPEPLVELLAAPVMAAPRYAGQPVYFSDVVVKAESPFETIEDLAGARWAFNEAHSYSGRFVLDYEAVRRGWRNGFYGSLVESGSHQTSLGLIAAGAVDAAAIDSFVLEAELRARPERARAFRVLESWGPAPAPPVVVSTRVSPAWRERWRTTLLAMHRDPAGRKILEDGGVARFAEVHDADYDPIRERIRWS